MDNKDKVDARTTVALNISKYLKLRGKSQVSLANYLGITKAAVSNWISSTTSPDINTIAKICEYLEISVNDLFGVYDEKNLSVEEKLMLTGYRSSGFRDAINKLLNL